MKYPWYSFLSETESTPGPQCGRKDYVNEKFQWHHRGTEPATFRLVAQWVRSGEWYEIKRSIINSTHLRLSSLATSFTINGSIIKTSITPSSYFEPFDSPAIMIITWSHSIIKRHVRVGVILYNVRRNVRIVTLKNHARWSPSVINTFFPLSKNQLRLQDFAKIHWHVRCFRYSCVQ
jgi:hypothetical protein